MVMDGLERYGKEILDRVHGKGWEVYDSTGAHTPEQGGEVIKRGPTTELKMGRRYVLLPKTESPADPLVVFDALERVASNGENPAITISGERHPWTGFSPGPEYVEVMTGRSRLIYYHVFITALNSIVDAKD